MVVNVNVPPKREKGADTKQSRGEGVVYKGERKIHVVSTFS